MKTIVPLFLFLFSYLTYGHEDYTIECTQGNAHLKCLIGWHEQQMDNKCMALLHLTEKLMTENGYSDHIEIHFIHDYTKRDTAFYALSYGTFEYYKGTRLEKKIKGNGLKILIRDRELNIKQVMNLIKAAFENTIYIKSNQVPIHIYQSGKGTDTILSIPLPQIERYMQFADADINKIIQDTVYLTSKSRDSQLGYYFHNNNYYFYNTGQVSGEKMLVTDNVREIFGSTRDGYFVFISDSVFYYISPFKYKVVGPCAITNVVNGRPPVRSFIHETIPINRFILIMEDYEMERKILFFPDSNLLVSDFGKKEEEFIIGLSQTEAKEISSFRFNKTYLGLLILLVLSLGVNIWLWTVKKNKV